MPLSWRRQSGPHCRQAARITSVSLSVRKAMPLASSSCADLAEIVDLAIVADRASRRSGASIGWAAASREVDDRRAGDGRGRRPARSRRRCRRARDGRARRSSPRPAPDRPAWARRDGRCRRCRTSAYSSPAARSASRSIGPERAQEIVDRRAGADPAAGSAETSTATARCGPPSRRIFIVSSFTPIPLPVSDSPTR